MNKKILMIDDDHMVVKTLEKLLQMEGYSVLIAESGAVALQIAEKEAVDLVITDIRMPNMNGVETINAINNTFKKNGLKEPPFIFITGYAESETNKSAKDLAPSDFLYKPFDKDAFLNSIKIALES